MLSVTFVRQSAGEPLFFDPQDWLQSNSVARLVTQGIEKKADIVHGNCDYMDEEARFQQFSLWQKPYAESKNRLSSYRNETL